MAADMLRDQKHLIKSRPRPARASGSIIGCRSSRFCAVIGVGLTMMGSGIAWSENADQAGVKVLLSMSTSSLYSRDCAKRGQNHLGARDCPRAKGTEVNEDANELADLWAYLKQFGSTERRNS